MDHSSYLPLLIITGLAVVVPILASRIPAIPIVVGEIVAGMVIGHSGFDLVRSTPALEFLAEFGFTFLMFLSGLEVDFGAISGNSQQKKPALWLRPIPLGLLILVATVGLATLGATGLSRLGLAQGPLLLGLILSTTSLGVVLPVLKEQRLLSSTYGQYLLVTATVADFVTLLSLTTVVAAASHGLELDVLVVVVLLAAFALIARLGMRFSAIPLLRRLVQELSHATAQIRVRGALALMVAWVALAQALGVELILGAFLAGAVVGLMDDAGESYLRAKLDAIGFGFFIPIFFINVGVEFNLKALMGSGSALALVPVLVAIAYAVKLLPALLLQPLFGWRRALAGGFLLSSRLSLIIAASAIALKIHAVSPALNAAIVLVAVITCTVSPFLFSRLYRPTPGAARRQGVIIAGSGQMAQMLSRRLRNTAQRVVVVGESSAELQALHDQKLEVIYGRPTDQSVLREAGAAKAEALIALLDDPDQTLALCQLARDSFAIPLVIAQASDLNASAQLQRLDVRVVQPAIALAVALEGALRFPTAFDVLVDQDDDVEFGEALVGHSGYHGTRLRHLRLPGNALILSICRDGAVLVPHGDTTIQRGDRIALIGSPEAVSEATELLSAAASDGQAA